MTLNLPKFLLCTLLSSAFYLGLTALVMAQTPLSVNKAIETALTNNPGYQSIDLGVGIAKLELEKAKAARLPILDIRGGYTRYSDPMIIVPIHETGVFPALDEDIFTSGVYAQLPLYTGGLLSATSELARAQIEGTEQKKESMKQDLIFSVVRYYSELLTIEKLKDASDQRLEFYRKEQVRINLLLSQGKATELDKAKISAQLEQANFERLQLDMAYDQNRVMLSALMSDAVPASLLLTKFSISQSLLPATLDDAIEIAKREHPVLREAETQTKAAESKINIARAARKPQVSAIGNARAMSGGDFTVQNEWQVGVQFSIPLFDGGIASRKVQQARLEKTKSNLVLDNLTNQTNAAINNAWQSISASKAGIRVSRTALEQAREAFRIETLRYRHNRSTLNDLTLSEAALWEASSNLARSENLFELSKAQLLKTMGVLKLGSFTPSLF